MTDGEFMQSLWNPAIRDLTAAGCLQAKRDYSFALDGQNNVLASQPLGRATVHLTYENTNQHGCGTAYMVLWWLTARRGQATADGA